MTITPYQAYAGLVTPRDFPRAAREYYRIRGWRIVEPGTPLGAFFRFTTRDWNPDSFLALADGLGVIEIALLVAKHPRHGAFSRLRDHIESGGYSLRIISPTGDFRAVLVAQGYTSHMTGDTFENRRDVWTRKMVTEESRTPGERP